MNVGDKFVLINKPPYSYLGHTDDPATFITVEVTECRETDPCSYTGRIGEGYIGEGSDGYQYALNYPEPSVGFSGPSWQRWMPDDDFLKLSVPDQKALVLDLFWKDVADYQCPAQATYCQPLDFINYCDTHQTHFYERRFCTKCKLKHHAPDVQMTLDKYAWPGWYLQKT